MKFNSQIFKNVFDVKNIDNIMYSFTKILGQLYYTFLKKDFVHLVFSKKSTYILSKYKRIELKRKFLIIINNLLLN